MHTEDSTLETPASGIDRPLFVPTLRVLQSDDRVVFDASRVLPTGETLLGRSLPGPGVRLDDAHASRQHARLELDARGRTATIENLSRRGTTLDGVPVTRAPLDDGAVIAAGHTLLCFRWETPMPPGTGTHPDLVGEAPSMRALRARVDAVAPSDSVVTILGETGTGKELVARAIHHASGRRGPFVAVNAAAIPEALAEAHLFGHVEGAFTGARAPGTGFFRAASGGTLFLDEIGELAPGLQAKLLRALETGTVVAVGTTREQPHGARVVTATHRDLVADVRSGRFRADLFARIRDTLISIAPLRERREDVLRLFLHGFGARVPAVEFAAARALVEHPWPFNVREVVRLSEQVRVVAGATLPRVELAMIDESLHASRALVDEEAEGAEPEDEAGEGATEARVGPPSKERLVELLRTHRGVLSDVAKAVGRSRKQVYRWVHAHGLDPDEFRS